MLARQYQHSELEAASLLPSVLASIELDALILCESNIRPKQACLDSLIAGANQNEMDNCVPGWLNFSGRKIRPQKKFIEKGSKQIPDHDSIILHDLLSSFDSVASHDTTLGET